MDWLDVLFPPKCVNCGQWGGYICATCEVGLWEAEPVCAICSKPSSGQTHRKCLRPAGLDGLTCWWTYQGMAYKIINRVKKSGRFDLLKGLLPKSKDLVGGPKFDGSFVVVGVTGEEVLDKAVDLVSKFYGLPRKKMQEIRSGNALLVDIVLSDPQRLQVHCRKLKLNGVQKVWGLVLARQ